MTAPGTVFITGANRGLGLEFATQYAARGWNVIAAARQPDKAADLQRLAAAHSTVTLETLDVGNESQIKALTAKYKGRPIDVLINNAAVLGNHEEQVFGRLNRQAFHDLVAVNSFGPIAVAEALQDSIAASRQKKIISITSGYGSITIGGRVAGAPLYYRMSKAALNMGTVALGALLEKRGILAAVVSPGVVDTDMLDKLVDEYNIDLPRITTPESVTKMIGIIDTLDAAKAAKGINNYDGKITPW